MKHPSTPAVPNCCCPKGSALSPEHQSARMSKKIKMVG